MLLIDTHAANRIVADSMSGGLAERPIAQGSVRRLRSPVNPNRGRVWIASYLRATYNFMPAAFSNGSRSTRTQSVA